MCNELEQVGLKDLVYHTNAFMLQAVIYNTNAEKVSYLSEKLAVENEKLAIESEKLSFQNIKLAIESQTYNEPTKKNILKVYEEIETNQIFGAPEIERVLKCSASTAKNVMKKLRDMGVVEEVKGKGKGKYTFISDFNYVKKVNEAGTNH